MFSLLWLCIGFFLLIKGADFLVDGASALARRLKVSDLVVGLTVVAFGTSTPELLVNVVSCVKGTTQLAISNILGSNIVNIFLILGFSAIIYPLKVTKNTTWNEIPLSLLAAVLVFVMANDVLIDRSAFSALTRIDGIVLLCFFIIFIYYVMAIAKVDVTEDKNFTIKQYTISKALLWIISGLVGLVIGGNVVVESAVQLAKHFGLSQSLIGLTVVAVGTSLPELVTSVVAAFKKNTDIAVGNVIGSNIFNIFWILGISATIRPLPFSKTDSFDALVTILASLALFVSMFTGKKRVIGRGEGAVFVLGYVSYLIYLVIRG